MGGDWWGVTRGQTIVVPLSSINNGPAKQLKNKLSWVWCL